MDAVLFYRSFYEAIKGLKLTDQAKVYDAVFAYALDGIEPELSGITKSIFTLIKPQIDANIKRRTNGSKGGRPTKTNGYENEKPMVTENDTEVTQNEKPNDNLIKKVKVKVNEKVNDKESVREKPQRFSPPTLDEIRAYCAERHSNVDPAKFLAYYESNGWMVGRNKMKDWKAAVRSWERSDFDKPKPLDGMERNNDNRLRMLEEQALRREI